jgi:hypothetical protein
MRTLARAAWLLATITVVLACGTRPAPTREGSPLGLDAAPWEDGSTASYVWLDKNGTEIGTSEIAFARQDEAWVITQADKIGNLNQIAEVSVSAKTLEPLGEKKTIQAPNTDIKLTTTYRDGKVDIKADVNGKAQNASMNAPANAVDNDQLLMTLRALPFAEGYKASYAILVTQNALKVDLTATVQRQEEVEVPAGRFNTWLVEMSTNQGKQWIWYEVEAPHALVQYDNGSTRMVLTKR